MTSEQILIFALLGAVLVLFAWGRWRYDLVAFGALIVAVLVGLVPPKEAFAGFGHPAVITVAVVLVLSRALTASGAVDLVTHRIASVAGRGPVLHIGVLGGLGAALSAFINNVGALALLMPVALQSAAKAKRSPSAVLMPLSFATILGGTITLIGTPPNIIIATYRGQITGEPFGMFDFAPVGTPVAALGLLFVALVGWRFIPKARRERRPLEELFAIDDYVTEAKVTEESAAAGKTLGEVEEVAEKHEAAIIGLIRDDRRLFGTSRHWRVRAGDVLIIEAAPEAMDKAVTELGLELVGRGKDVAKKLSAGEWTLAEAVVTQGSLMEGRTPERLRLGSRYGITVLGVSRRGKPFRGRLRSFRFEVGDILLLQADKEEMPRIIAELGCLPLAERGLQLGKRKWMLAAAGLFAVGIALTAFGVLPPQIALGGAMLAIILLNIVSPDEAYKAIDWRVIILLGAMIPVGGALETTGAADLIAASILGLAGEVAPALIVALLMIVTMTLSDVVNNAATAVLMAPIGAGLAAGMGLNTDPFLMAVAVGASCAFLTPIGHQNNTLILGPGGYRFGDYWRMGLPLEVLIVAVAIPLILIVWPL